MILPLLKRWATSEALSKAQDAEARLLTVIAELNLSNRQHALTKLECARQRQELTKERDYYMELYEDALEALRQRAMVEG